jgi:hypothetical protein
VRSIILIFVALNTTICERAIGMTALPAGAPLPVGAGELIEVTDGSGNILIDAWGKPMYATTNFIGLGFVTNSDVPPGTFGFSSAVDVTAPGTPGVADAVSVACCDSVGTETPPINDRWSIGLSVLSGPPYSVLCFSSHGGVCTPETGQVEDFTSLLFPGDATPPFHVLAGFEVPEPSTAALLAVAITGLAALRHGRSDT